MDITDKKALSKKWSEITHNNRYVGEYQTPREFLEEHKKRKVGLTAVEQLQADQEFSAQDGRRREEFEEIKRIIDKVEKEERIASSQQSMTEEEVLELCSSAEANRKEEREARRKQKEEDARSEAELRAVLKEGITTEKEMMQSLWQDLTKISELIQDHLALKRELMMMKLESLRRGGGAAL